MKKTIWFVRIWKKMGWVARVYLIYVSILGLVSLSFLSALAYAWRTDSGWSLVEHLGRVAFWVFFALVPLTMLVAFADIASMQARRYRDE